MHPRQAIREAARAQIIAADTAAEDRVFETRVVPWRNIDLPAISVYTLDESVDPDSRNTAPRELTRRMTLEIVGTVKAGANVDDALDDLALEIERAMHSDFYLGETCADSILTSTTIGIDTSGSQPLGQVALAYQVTYYSNAPDSDVALDTFNAANIRHKLENTVHVDNEAVDTLTDINQE